MTQEQQLRETLSARTPEGTFQPCAIFHDRLDFVRVIVRDCSITSTRINELVSVLEDTHYTPGQGERYVGFTIKGIKHFCRSQGIPTDAPVKLADVLTAILKKFPERDVELAIDGVARRLVRDMSVNLKSSNVALVPAA